jgi:hypothetical protein
MVLEFLKRQNKPLIYVKAESIASEFSCHHNTARAILNRLMLAGDIEIDKSYRKIGYVCRIK